MSPRRTSRLARSALAGIAAALAGAAPAWAAHPRPVHRASRLPPVQVAYLTSCGGCHGIEGVSAPRAVPTLRHLVGSFLCTREGRQFIVRLPDVALSDLSDRMLTRVMNWVVLDVGAPAGGWAGAKLRAGFAPRPYTVAEVARLRREPLTQTGVTAYRERVVAHLQARCAVPAALGAYVPAYGAGVRSPAKPGS